MGRQKKQTQQTAHTRQLKTIIAVLMTSRQGALKLLDAFHDET
jgi:hypothetical protein